MDQLKIGVIGAGSMGRNHVRILAAASNAFDMQGFYDADPNRAAEVAQQFHVKAYADADALMDAVDAVVIAVPSSMHHAVALAAARRGLHALVEKPLSLTLPEASEIANAFEKAGKTLAVGHVERFNPVVTELVKLLRCERVQAIEVRRYGPYNGRINDANVVQDLMIHDIDLVCNVLMPGRPSFVSAAGRSVKSGKLDYVHSILQFPDGAVATLGASRTTENKIREIAIHTDKSYIVADLLSRSLSVIRNANLVIDAGRESAYRQDSVTQKIFVPMIEPLQAELQAFYDCVTQGKESTANGAAACRAIELCEEIVRKASGFTAAMI